MRNLSTWLMTTLLVMSLSSYSFGQCQDPDAQIWTDLDGNVLTHCGNAFDLCMDFYDFGTNKRDTFILNIFSNDGDVDFCASDTVIGTKHGDIVRLPNCQWAYVPRDEFYVELRDSFDYKLVINDTCVSDPDYCDAGNGKFWTINSRYEGALGVDSIKATSKKGKGTEAIIITGQFPLNTGDYFFADGTSLSSGQSNWTFTFYYENLTSESVTVHTSCSAPILNLTHPAVNQNGNWVSVGNVMTPVSGCVATNGNQANCIMDPPFARREEIKVRNEVTTQFVDTTRVLLTVNNFILPIEFGHFKVESKKNNNQVSWGIKSVTGEDKLVLQKSYNGTAFFDLMVYDEINTGNFEYDDPDIKKALNYYRLSVSNYGGETRYSDIIINRRPGISRSIHIYPRPSFDETNISVDGSDDGSEIVGLEVIDMSGKLVKRLSSLKGRTTRISLNDISLNAGLYMIRVTLSDGDILYDKLIKK